MEKTFLNFGIELKGFVDLIFYFLKRTALRISSRNTHHQQITMTLSGNISSIR